LQKFYFPSMENFKHRTKRIEGPVNFSFYKVSSLQGREYLVIASDYQSQHQLFYMHEEANQWKITEPGKVWNWVIQLEQELSEAISQHQIYAM
jgi:hypothetical protein